MFELRVKITISAVGVLLSTACSATDDRNGYSNTGPSANPGGADTGKADQLKDASAPEAGSSEDARNSGNCSKCLGNTCEMLSAVNAARTQARVCGVQHFGPAPPLFFDCRLAAAAERHAQDLAESGKFSHVGSDGSTPGKRATEAGFPWYSVAENIAAGQSSLEDVMAGWLESPGHCRNIMNPDLGYLGSAHVHRVDAEYRDYWVQVFASY